MRSTLSRTPGKPEPYSMKALQSKFERPPAEIHAIAGRVRDAVVQGSIAEAIESVDGCRDTQLAYMIEIFALVKAQYMENPWEKAIVFLDRGQYCSIAVDSVLTVEYNRPFNYDPSQRDFLNIDGSGLIFPLAKQARPIT